MASDHIQGDMVEVTEFPHLAVKHSLQGVPHTVINDKVNVVGAVSESEFAKKVLEAIGK